MKSENANSKGSIKKQKLRVQNRLKRSVQRLDCNVALGAFADIARRAFMGIERLEHFLGPDAVPMYWAIDVEGRADDDIFEDWEIYRDQMSKDQLEAWVNLGGRVELVRARGDADLVVVRLINIEKKVSCFGVSFPTESGRGFWVVENDDVRKIEILRKVLRDEKLSLSDLDESNFEFFFLNAPVQLVMPRKHTQGGIVK